MIFKKQSYKRKYPWFDLKVSFKGKKGVILKWSNCVHPTSPHP